MIAETTSARSRETMKIQHRIGVPKAEFLKRLRAVKFSPSDRRELKQAMDASARVFGYAGGH